uniref:Uncharacterized protein n=1 Tax=Pygocentrus nattereri TaxID=42514 RepID=A0AAR2J5W9_PYGNA
TRKGVGARSTGGPPRNWKGICIAMVVILGVLSLVSLSIILLTPDESHLLLHSRLTVEDLESEEFKVHDPCATWLNGKGSTECTHSDVQKYRSLTLCCYCEVRFMCACLCDLVCCRELVDLSPTGVEVSVLQYAAWGPQGNQLMYVFENDIYYKADVSSPAMRLTTTEGLVVNGLTDWIYEEEILQKYPAHWWSKDGARLAYLKINNSATPVMEIPYFLGGLYPSNVLYPYPKAGSSIPLVNLFVVNLYGPAHTLEMIPPDSQNSRDSYISMVSWISSTRLAVRWLNRVQNQSVLCVCEATTGACSEVRKSTEEPLFSADGSQFYLTLPAKQGACGEFRHIASLPAQPALPSASPRFLTSGNWDVTTLCALDEKNGKIYFLSTEESRHSRHLYSAELGGVFHRHCLTCKLFERCSFFRADFSPNQTHFTLYCLGPGVPKVTIHSTNDSSRDLTTIVYFYIWCSLLFFLLPRTSMYILIFLSSSLSHSDGSPGSQTVTEEFSLGWPQVLSSLHGVSLAWVDGRIRASRGQKTSTVDPRKLGSLRIKDQLGVVEWLSQLPYIDGRRIALYGKGFGGYLILKILTATEQMFRCSAIMAPITEFKLYNAAFSERYLGLPGKEEHAYMTASLLEDVHKLKDENFLLLHGTADARVHFQHSAELLSRLVKVEANYTLQLYPDEGHTLREERSIQHLHRSLLHYLHNCLKHDPFLVAEEEEEEEED